MISIGDIVAGTVVACESFGAFIEHDGVQYFVPMHELSWDKLRHSSDAVSVGDRCEIIIDRPDNSPPGDPLASVRRVHGSAGGVGVGKMNSCRGLCGNAVLGGRAVAWTSFTLWFQRFLDP